MAERPLNDGGRVGKSPIQFGQILAGFNHDSRNDEHTRGKVMDVRSPRFVDVDDSLSPAACRSSSTLFPAGPLRESSQVAGMAEFRPNARCVETEGSINVGPRRDEKHAFVRGTDKQAWIAPQRTQQVKLQSLTRVLLREPDSPE